MNAIESLAARRSSRRNSFNPPLAALVGMLLTAADAFLHPLIVLPLFALKVNASTHTIALISTAGAVSWFVALICASSLRRLVPRSDVAATIAAVVRAGAIVVLAFGIHDQSRGHTSQLSLFFFCFIIYSAAQGLAREPSLTSLTHALNAGRARWSAGAAMIGGGALSIAAGLVIYHVMSHLGPGFPESFSLIFACAAIALCAAAFFTTRIREGIRIETATHPAKALPVGIANAFATPLMRRYLAYRLSMALLAGADPFFFVFAYKTLKTPQELAGIFLVVYAAAAMLSTPFWQWLNRRAGNRVSLQIVASVRIVAPLIALILPNVVNGTLYLKHVHNPRLEDYLFAAAFGALGVAARGQSLSGSSYVAEIAPERHHEAYAFLANCSIVVAGLTPLIAARIIETDGFNRLFLCAAIAGLIAVFVSGLLGETHARIRNTAQALRPRGIRSS